MMDRFMGFMLPPIRLEAMLATNEHECTRILGPQCHAKHGDFRVAAVAVNCRAGILPAAAVVNSPLPPRLRPTMLGMTTEAEALARHYAAERIVPARFHDDLLHVAVAVCHRLDMIVSWNMRHLANPNKMARINEVNRLYGWPLTMSLPQASASLPPR